MERYRINATTVEITESTTLQPDDRYGAWMAVNQGTATAKVMGYELQPGEGVSFLDAVPAGSHWGSPIQIICNAGASVRVTRLQYMPIVEKKG